MKKRIKTWAIIVVIFVIILCLLYWKWPHPLLSYFDATEPTMVGGIILFRNNEEVRQLDFNETKSLAPLWEAIQNTKVRHLGGYKTMTIDDSLYLVRIQTQRDGHSGTLSFDCGSDGYVYISNSKYEIFGSSELLPILKQYFN